MKPQNGNGIDKSMQPQAGDEAIVLLPGVASDVGVETAVDAVLKK